MKTVIIHGQSHKGSTYHIAHKLAEKIGGEIMEFFLPRDFREFCLGCTNCFVDSEKKCPHYDAEEFPDEQYKFLGASVYDRRNGNFDFVKGDRPLIYISLGTIVKGSTSFFRNCIEAFRDEQHFRSFCARCTDGCDTIYVRPACECKTN